MVNDLGVLIINQSKSFFSGYENFRDDSLKSSVVKKFIEGTQKGNLRFPDARNKSRFQKVIFKNLSNDSLTQEEKFFVTSFHINFNCKMNWKMEKDEPKNYFGYTCKKATLNFGGSFLRAIFSSFPNRRRYTFTFTQTIRRIILPMDP